MSGRRAVHPPSSAEAARALRLSPGVVSNGHLFLTGMTGSGPNGMPRDPETQFRAAFDKIGAVLAEAGLSFGSVVEMTSYHLDIEEHFALFSDVRAEYVVAPFPAWTAVEVAGLRRAGALVEIRAVAAID